jgi:DNA-binding CsgD family transcriptional regulator
MNILDKVFDKSTEAVFGINAAGSVLFTNKKFERLLGYSRNQLCGSWCAEVLCGTSLHGKPFCGRQCPIPKTSTGQPSITDFDLIVKHANGHDVLVNIGTSYIQPQPQDTQQVKVFFSLRQVNPQRMLQRMAMPPVKKSLTTGSGSRNRLTSREEEILGLAVNGMKTKLIAIRLSISIQTVRSHFKNIYYKLNVNSRTEAVIFAIQHGPH